MGRQKRRNSDGGGLSDSAACLEEGAMLGSLIGTTSVSGPAVLNRSDPMNARPHENS